MKKVQVRNSLLLLLTAAIWGSAFVAQSVGMDYVEPFTFNCVRSLIGGFVLIPCIAFLNRKKPKQEPKTEKQKKQEKKILLTGGILCGFCLFAASNFQQLGIQYTTVGKAGFITACYIVIVPVLGIFLNRKCGQADLDFGGSGACGAVSVVYDRITSDWQRRPFGACLRLFVFFSYPGDRPFLTAYRRRENVLHPVFCVRDSIGNRHASDRRTASCGHLFRMEADSLCGRAFLRGSLYLADCRTEGYESYGSVPDYESGVLYFRAGRVAGSGAC